MTFIQINSKIVNIFSRFLIGNQDNFLKKKDFMKERS